MRTVALGTQFMKEAQVLSFSFFSYQQQFWFRLQAERNNCHNFIRLVRLLKDGNKYVSEFESPLVRVT